MENVKKALIATDWMLLAQQKQVLLTRLNPEGGDQLDGLLHFLDAIQDAVVEDGLAPEYEVFPSADWHKMNPL